jgi:hypothetical protein
LRGTLSFFAPGQAGFWLLIIVVVALVILGGVALWRRDPEERKRLAEQKAVATKLGLSFRARDDEITSQIPQPVHKGKRNRKARGVMRGDFRGQKVVAFREAIRLSDEATAEHTVVAFDVSGRDLPAFTMQHRYASEMRAIGDLFGIRTGIGFGGVFDKMYRVLGDDEPAIREFLTHAKRIQLEDQEVWAMACDGKWIAMVKQGDRPPAEQLEAYVNEAVGVMEILDESAKPQAAEEMP